MKTFNKVLVFLTSLLGGLVVACIAFVLSSFIVAALTYTISIKDFSDLDQIEQELKRNDINIDIKTVDKIDGFVAILGEYGEGSQLLVLGNDSFYFKDHYKKLIGNTFYSEDFSQQFFSGLFEYRLHFQDGNFFLERKNFSPGNISTGFPSSLIIGLLSAYKIKRKLSAKS